MDKCYGLECKKFMDILASSSHGNQYILRQRNNTDTARSKVKNGNLGSQAADICTIRTGTRVGNGPRQQPTVIWKGNCTLVVVKSRHGPLELVVVNGDLGSSW